MLFKRLLEAPVMKSCDEVFSAFDESLLFKGEHVRHTATSIFNLPGTRKKEKWIQAHGIEE